MSNKTQRPSFADVKATSLKEISRVLAHWLPNGKRVDGGKEYTAPNPTRADKRAGSLKVNLSKGTWADFATDDKGGDLIDLVRYLDGGTDVDACNKLAELLRVTAGAAQSKPSPNKSKPPEWLAIQPIPAEAMNKCPAKHRQHGAPSKVWMYRDAQGQPVMALYRFDLGPDEDGKARQAETEAATAYAQAVAWGDTEGEKTANADAQKAAKNLSTATEHHRRQHLIITALEQELVTVDRHITEAQDEHKKIERTALLLAHMALEENWNEAAQALLDAGGKLWAAYRLIDRDQIMLFKLVIPEEGENFGSWNWNELSERARQHTVQDVLKM